MMIHDVIKWKFLFLICFILLGCKEDTTTNYWMTHPVLLQKALQTCYLTSTPSCDSIIQAAEDFQALMEEQLSEPESFGKRIMLAQENSVRLLKEYEKVKRTDDSDKIKMAWLAYHHQWETLQILYAVVGLQGPE